MGVKSVMNDAPEMMQRIFHDTAIKLRFVSVVFNRKYLVKYYS